MKVRVNAHLFCILNDEHLCFEQLLEVCVFNVSCRADPELCAMKGEFYI